VKTTYVIKHDNGTYYAGWTAIGPCFGATLEQAERFRSMLEAHALMGRHFAFASATVERLDAKKARPVERTP